MLSAGPPGRFRMGYRVQDLWLASLFFLGTHLGIPSSRLRDQLVQRLGGRVYRLLYSLLAVVGLLWMVSAYRDAPHVPLFGVGTGLRHLAIGLMPFALLPVVWGLTAPNPMAPGQRPDADARDPATGMLRVTRHPFLWGVALWAVLHVLANGHLAALVFFGSFALLAVAGSVLIDRRRMRAGGPGWGIFFQSTSNLPFLAILQRRQRLAIREIGGWRTAVAAGAWLVLLVAHGWLFGRPLF